jgi:tRNA nucleotidyltransferase (CCA-adding enzyme)
MELIATHIGADFDALASLVACSRLHPGAKMLHPGTLRPKVREFLSLHKDTLQLYSSSQLDLNQCQTLYVVDANSLERLGNLSWLGQVASRIVWYDHHPGEQPQAGTRSMVGAATTILVEKLQERSLTISSFEATLYMLGIYEDTGCLSFPGTTVRDIRASAWLLEQGANLGEIGRYINGPLSPEQRLLFEELLANARTETLRGRKILILVGDTEEYVGGLGRLTHRLAELEHCDIVVSVVRMENRVHILVHCLLPELDMLDILAPLGMAGHASVASLTMKGTEVSPIVEKILAQLRERLPQGKLAGTLMSSPVKSMDDNKSIAEANSLLLRYGHTGMPVVNQNQDLVGIISRRDVDKAMRHGLGHAPVRGYMTKNVVTVGINATLEDITRIMIRNDIGRLPVLEKDKLVGIITRTDILRETHGEATPRWHQPLYSQRDYQLADKNTNLTELINQRLPKRIQGILLLMGQKAAKGGYNIYAIGGFVRDLVLGLPNYDLDIVVESNAIEFAKLLPPLLGGKVHSHEEFGTATLTLPDGYQIDFATARMEFYQFPAASPEVEQTTIRHDLYRRDFTINTLAFSLTSGNFGRFLDFFGGYDDLQSGTIRVLYNLSFVEDPTRILRAVRFAARYGFAIEEQTKAFMTSAIEERMLERTGAGRLGHEFRLIFQEPNVPAIINLAGELGVSLRLLPGLKVDDHLMGQLASAAILIAWNQEQDNPVEGDGWLLYPYILLKNIPLAARTEVLPRLGLTVREGKRLEALLKELDNVAQLLSQEHLPGSEVYSALRPLPGEALLALLAFYPHVPLVRSRVLLYQELLADTAIALNGADLQQMGYKPGPHLGRVLRALQKARLDGQISTPAEEEALAKKLLTLEEGK